jgi:hypothetical protein
MPNGTRGNLTCFEDGEDWYATGDIQKFPQLVQEHQEAFQNWTVATGDGTHLGFPYYWPKGGSAVSQCPRGIDCPDWRYIDEEPYSRQLNLLKSLSKVLDIGKVAIGFEVLGTDVLVQQ